MNHDTTPFTLTYPLAFVAKTAATSALACAGGLGILWWVFSRDLGTEYGPAFYTLKSLMGFLVPALVFSFLAVLFVASLAVFAVAVFASHKVAGPLFRLQRVAWHLCRGTLVGRIHLRIGDQGKPLAGAINAWVDRRKSLLASYQGYAKGATLALQQCEEALVRGDEGALSSSIEAFCGSLSDLPITDT